MRFGRMGDLVWRILVVKIVWRIYMADFGSGFIGRILVGGFR